MHAASIGCLIVFLCSEWRCHSGGSCCWEDGASCEETRCQAGARVTEKEQRRSTFQFGWSKVSGSQQYTRYSRGSVSWSRLLASCMSVVLKMSEFFSSIQFQIWYICFIIPGFSTVWSSLETGAKLVGKSVASETVTTVKFKWVQPSFLSASVLSASFKNICGHCSGSSTCGVLLYSWYFGKTDLPSAFHFLFRFKGLENLINMTRRKWLRGEVKGLWLLHAFLKSIDEDQLQ